jgi:hypothetical protein
MWQKPENGRIFFKFSHNQKVVEFVFRLLYLSVSRKSRITNVLASLEKSRNPKLDYFQQNFLRKSFLTTLNCQVAAYLVYKDVKI